MKKAKKLASLLLALVMALALAAPAMAADTGSITLDNPQEGQTYTAYKIFDVSYSGDAYSYTIDSASNKWFATVQAYATDANGLKLTQVNGGTTYFVTKGENFSAAAFAAILKDKVVGGTADAEIVATGEPMPVADGKATATNLPLGYYFVSSTNGALCNLTTTNLSVTIHDKNDMPFDKVDDKQSVEIGETVTYTITGKVPDTTGFSDYTYKITDTMSEGLTFQKNVVVKIGDTDVTDCITTYTPSDDAATGFELTIPVKNYQGQVGQPITVTYTAVVNENAVAVVSENTAILQYSNDPTNNTSTTETPPDKETVYSAKIVIDKYKEGNETTKLEGAKFVLYKEVADGSNTVKKYYKCEDTTKVVSWVDDQTAATEVTTDSNGAASFDGLKDGTYYLLETAAPAGYNLLDEPVTITIKGTDNDNTTPVEANLTHTEVVENSTGAVLPSTGGMGTTIFYVTGSILVLAAVVLLVTKKRMKSAK